ncbi:hypothetical protein KIL84_017130 [Mauremys mutica]|uniref:Large ribosomal subunit protein bL33m n=1 Tax=Mauremys mutica TaxID=74926 RepID=A0A9D3X5K1_9SAUR|nr:hypothetical protein KIL84_017130 [Mauremys mutica]
MDWTALGQRRKSKSTYILVRMVSAAGTGYCYNIKRARLQEKLVLLKYDPIVGLLGGGGGNAASEILQYVLKREEIDSINASCDLKAIVNENNVEREKS